MKKYTSIRWNVSILRERKKWIDHQHSITSIQSPLVQFLLHLFRPAKVSGYHANFMLKLGAFGRRFAWHLSSKVMYVNIRVSYWFSFNRYRSKAQLVANEIGEITRRMFGYWSDEHNTIIMLFAAWNCSQMHVITTMFLQNHKNKCSMLF